MDDNNRIERYSYEWWKAELSDSEAYFGDYFNLCDRITNRYRDDREASISNIGYDAFRFNILWSNTQVLLPALYSRMPEPVIDRRYRDSDALGRLSASLLERSCTFQTQTNATDATFVKCVLDFALGGRGTNWVRFVPYTKDGKPVYEDKDETQISQDQYPLGEQKDKEIDENDKKVSRKEYGNEKEEIIIDYVAPRDFLHNRARYWPDEISWVARKVYLTKEEVKPRFGSAIANDNLTLVNSDGKIIDREDSESMSKENRAVFFEIWCKTNKKVYWINTGLETFADTKDDPLGLSCFFPCPVPLYATLTNSSTIPVPDYVEYQDLARELDEINGKASVLRRSIGIKALYDASVPRLAELVNETADNTAIGIDQWQLLMERGGISGAIQMLSNNEKAQVLQILEQAGDKCIQRIFEITGISDIVRGQSSPSETLGAQQLKSQNYGVRIGQKRRAIEAFIRDTTIIVAEIIARKFSAKTIIEMSGAGGVSDPNVPLYQAIALLRDDVQRSYRIDIETDSTSFLDDNNKKQAVNEFIQGVTGFISQLVNVKESAPEFLPAMGEMLMYMVRNNKAGRAVEDVISKSVDGLVQGSYQQAVQAAAEQSAQQQIQEFQAQQAAQQEQQAAQEEQIGAMASAQADQILSQSPPPGMAGPSPMDQIKMTAIQLENQRKTDKDRAEINLKAMRDQRALDLKQAKDAAEYQLARERLTLDAEEMMNENANAQLEIGTEYKSEQEKLLQKTIADNAENTLKRNLGLAELVNKPYGFK